MDNREYASELYHHGILGQKWGVRRFQNEDGSLTEEGRKRYLAPGSKYGFTREQSDKFAKKFLSKEERKNIKKTRKELMDADRRENAAYDKKLKDAGFYSSAQYKEWEHFVDEAVKEERLDNSGEAEIIYGDYLRDLKKEFAEKKGITRGTSDRDAYEEYKKVGRSIVDRLLNGDVGSMRDYEIDGVRLGYSDRQAVSQLVARYAYYNVKDL